MIDEDIDKALKAPQLQQIELLNRIDQKLTCIATQNEDLIEIQNSKIDILCAIDARDELVMKMYKRKNLWSGVFGVFGLSLTLVSTILVGVGLYFLPEETRMLFDELMMLAGLV